MIKLMFVSLDLFFMSKSSDEKFQGTNTWVIFLEIYHMVVHKQFQRQFL
jgi:hypothetical protein